MKRILILAALLAGCNGEPSRQADQAGDAVYTDPVTGCQYLQIAIRSGITPRIAADGKTHMGCKAVAP